MDILEEINWHREVLGYEPLTVDDDLEYHLDLINKTAPYGEDPWEDE